MLETPTNFHLLDSLKKWKILSYKYVKCNVYLNKRKHIDDGDMKLFCRSSSFGAEKLCDKDCLCA